MKIKFPHGEAPIAAILFAAFFAKFFFDDLRLVPPRQNPRVTRASAEFQALSLRRFNFGFKNVLADALWVQLLQQASHGPLARDEVSWEYAQLNSIISLDPKFSKAYPFGASFLSVFRRDRQGAQLVLEKWTRFEPNYWRTHYLLGYHYFFEQKKFEQASRSILRAASLPGAPNWLTSLGVRLISQTGAHFSALQVALELYPTLTSLEGRYRLRKRIRSLRFTLLKTAWQHALDTFPSGRRPASTADIVPEVQKELVDLSAALQQISIPEDLEDIFVENFIFQYNPSTHSIDFINNLPKEELRELESSGIHTNQGDA
jgi:hypothetical protein